MTQKEFFEAGSKLLGLYALLMVLIILVGVVPTLVALLHPPNSKSDSVVYELVYPIAPIALGIVGLYLLKSRGFSRRMVPTEDQLSASQAAEYFTIGVKLYAIYLVISTVPGLVQALANLLFLADHPQTATSMLAVFSMPHNILPHLAVVVFGLALLLKGEILTRWVFPAEDTE